jgi:hypothetical protein
LTTVVTNDVLPGANDVTDRRVFFGHPSLSRAVECSPARNCFRSGATSRRS